MIASRRGDAVRLFLFVAAALAVFLLLFNFSGGTVIPGQGGYKVEAIVPDSLGMSKNADVRQAGVHIGRVTETRNIGRTTAMMLELDDDHAPVYQDATVLIRTKSVAGENYVELDPGRPHAGAVADGGRLTVDHTQEATQLDEILSVLNERRRHQLQRALSGLGGGLDGHGGDLNRFLESTSGAVRSGASLTALLEADREHVAGLVDSVGRVTRALGERRAAIGILVRQAKVTAEAVAARNAELAQTLRVLPPFLGQVRTTADRLRGFSVEATPVVRDLRLALRDLTPAVADLRDAAPAGSAVVRELLPFARALEAPVDALRPFSRAASNAVPSLAATLRQANPLIAHLKPYAREFATTFAQIGAAVKYTDTIGHLGRLVIMFSRASLPGTLPADQSEILEQLEQLAGGEANSLGANAYPAPGEAGLSNEYPGSYPQLEAEPPYAR